MKRYLQDLFLSDEPAEDSFLCTLPAVQALKDGKRLSLDAPITFFVGENGTGKSTLLEAIAVAFGLNPEGGSKNFSFSTFDSHADLSLGLSKLHLPRDSFFLRAESFYNAAGYLDRLEEDLPGVIDAYGGVSLHKQSHGESFLSLMQNRFFGNGLYLLDEPEAALSPMRQLSLLVLLRDLVQKDSQFIIATHSPILMAYPDALIYEFTGDGISRVNYRETEHYRVTRMFLENPERMLQQLWE